jgi:hypothetical protein
VDSTKPAVAKTPDARSQSALQKPSPITTGDKPSGNDSTEGATREPRTPTNAPASHPSAATTQPNEPSPKKSQSEKSQPNRAQPNRAQPNRAQPNRAQPNRAQPNRAQPRPAKADGRKPTTAELLGVASLPTGSLRKRRATKNKKPAWVLPAIITASILGLGGLIAVLSGGLGDGSKSSQDAASTPMANADKANLGALSDTSDTESSSTVPTSDDYLVRADNGTLPWLPPNAIDPIEFTWLPAGGQAFLAIDPTVLRTNAAIAIIETTLDESSRAFFADQRSAIGVPLADIRQMIVAMYPGAEGWPQTATRIELKSPLSIDELTTVWGDADRQLTPARATLFVRDEIGYFVPEEQLASDSISIFTVTQLDRAIELAESGNSTLPLRLQMETLRQSTTKSNDVTFLFAPSFLIGDGRQLIQQFAPNYRNVLNQLLQPTIQAGLVTLALEPDFFGELRMVSSNRAEAKDISQSIESVFDALLPTAETQLVAQPAAPFFRAIELRLAAYLRQLRQNQRFGIEDGQAISNVYLPQSAADDLPVAAWMMARNWGGLATDPSGVANRAELSAEELLDNPITISFEQQSLETALESIVVERNASLPTGTQPLTFEIDGTAFEASGITRNKEIAAMDYTREPFRNVLTELAKRANPTVVDDPTSDEQAVVWQLDTEGVSQIRLTTKKALQAAGKEPPKEFSN